jgi:hypothetical protein
MLIEHRVLALGTVKGRLEDASSHLSNRKRPAKRQQSERAGLADRSTIDPDSERNHQQFGGGSGRLQFRQEWSIRSL